ncbi:Zinc finger HIT domain-containing protein 3 [Blattella germanica]|nr:Zinc finger HIT domain-containing protein 3 [Blattella germanica]
MSCNICGNENSKYKCPNCRILYCSLDCWKEHKKVECKFVPKEQENVDAGSSHHNYMFETEDTVPLDKLRLLEESKNLMNILENPQLRDLLLSVDKSTNPVRTMQLAMQEPLFVKFADECLRVLEPVEDSPQV